MSPDGVWFVSTRPPLSSFLETFLVSAQVFDLSSELRCIFSRVAFR